MGRAWRVIAMVTAVLLWTAGANWLIQPAQGVAPYYDAGTAEGSLYRLYRAYFGREPDASGFTYWYVTATLGGTSFDKISDSFAASSEFQTTYGDLDDSSFVNLVYQNVLSRTADSGGLSYWLGRMADGLSRGRVMRYLSDSSEYKRNTNTGVPPGWRAGSNDVTLLNALTVEDEHSRTGFRPDLFQPNGWDDEDHDGCDTRCEVLANERRSDGSWFSWWDGQRVTVSSFLDIDYTVALAEAWDSGADLWTPEKRDTFGDWQTNLVAVGHSINLSKSDHDAAEWSPPRTKSRCLFAEITVTTKYHWGLSVDQAEKDALLSDLTGCDRNTSDPPPVPVAQPKVVSEQPSEATPHIVLGDGESVYAFAQVGTTVFAGGRFDQVQSPDRSQTYNRQNFFAFDSQTGAIKPLQLSFDGLVSVITNAPDGKAIYIGGSFKTVNGAAHRALVKYDLTRQQLDTSFNPTTANTSTVADVKFAGGSVIVGGSFARALVALDPATGADTGAINISVAGRNDPAELTRVRRIAVSPDATRLVATGNFTTVNGEPRSRAFQLHLGHPSTLSTWHSPRFDETCNQDRLVTLQGVDFSPNGKYFVIVATGGAVSRGLCDAAARFETSNESNTAQPTWINATGGDSLWSVAVTGAAVYVGGHQRWLDNTFGHDNAGPGAVSRPGIGAIDPGTGKALLWNPTKSLDHGTVELFATTCGLWVGSDGPEFAHEYHAGIAYVPVPGTAADCVPTSAPT